FVAARNELVKRARAAKQDALARELAALRKPHAVVWLVNQLARRHPAQATALLEAGKQLREAQHKALHGTGTAALRDANQAWRGAEHRAERQRQREAAKARRAREQEAAKAQQAAADAERAAARLEGRSAEAAKRAAEARAAAQVAKRRAQDLQVPKP